MVFTALPLKLPILFEEIVHVEHKAIVRGAEGYFEADGAGEELHFPLKAVDEAVASRGGNDHS